MRVQINPGSPLTRILAAILGVLVLITAVIIGSVVLTALIGLTLIAGIAFYVHLWWLRRKIRRAMQRGEPLRGGGDRIIETEYRVVDVSDQSTPSDRHAHDAQEP